MLLRCSTWVGVGISLFVVTTSCRGFIVRPIATQGLVSLTDTYAKASRTATVRSCSATCGQLVSGSSSTLVRKQRKDRASGVEVLDVNVATASVTTASRFYFFRLNLSGFTSSGAS